MTESVSRCHAVALVSCSGSVTLMLQSMHDVMSRDHNIPTLIDPRSGRDLRERESVNMGRGPGCDYWRGRAEGRQLEPGTRGLWRHADTRGGPEPGMERGERYKCLKMVVRPLQWDTDSRTVNRPQQEQQYLQVTEAEQTQICSPQN